MTEQATDHLAQLVYPATFVVCATWVGIAIAFAFNGHRVRYALLALSMLFAGAAFGLLAYNAGRNVVALPDILLYFRVLMTMATTFGGLFTVVYLRSIYKHGPQGGEEP